MDSVSSEEPVLQAAHAAHRLEVLDAFRALAILAVVAHHYLVRWAPPDHYVNLYHYSRVYPHWIDYGALGVQFFFIISGFVIFMTLERCNHVFEFWFRRFARLYPAYLACTLLTYCVVNLFGPAEFHASATDLGSSVLFLASYGVAGKFVEPAVWSLVVELQFYFLLGVVFALAKQRVLLAWTCMMIVAAVLWCAGGGPGLHVFRTISQYVFLFPYLPYFTLGLVFYRLHQQRPSHCAALGAVALASYVVVNINATLVVHLAQLAMIALFVLFLSGKLKWLVNAPLVLIGNISYSLYLIHQYAGVTILRELKLALGLPDLLAALLALVTCAMLAYAVTVAIEMPAKRILLGVARPRLSSLMSRFPAFGLPKVPVS